ncbi:hypothetical protein T190607A01A_10423 [Tenacibaculum sp. 190524A05c]|uniref:Uncharacterized protein n=1 Tax=Tenacibaculum platacis TaxID=3137852 RepID=A0ABM9NS15_9FLAO
MQPIEFLSMFVTEFKENMKNICTYKQWTSVVRPPSSRACYV